MSGPLDRLDLEGFKKRFPGIPEDRVEDVLRAYALITSAAPTIVLHPTVLATALRLHVGDYVVLD